MNLCTPKKIFVQLKKISTFSMKTKVIEGVNGGILYNSLNITKAVPEYLFSFSKPNKWNGNDFIYIQLLTCMCTIVNCKSNFETLQSIWNQSRLKCIRTLNIVHICMDTNVFNECSIGKIETMPFARSEFTLYACCIIMTKCAVLNYIFLKKPCFHCRRTAQIICGQIIKWWVLNLYR